MAGLAALLGVVGSVLGFLGFKTFKESRELVQKKAEEESENLSALRSSIGLMMTFQNFIMVNHPILTSLAKDIRAMQPSDKSYSEKRSRLKSVAEQIIDDLNRMREHDKELNRVAPNQEPRWAAWINGWHGLTLHSAGQSKQAIPYLDRAIQLSRGRDQSAKNRRANIQPGLLLRSLGDKR